MESTSTVDATGARVVVQASQNRLMRVLGVDSEAVNWSWLSDKDRFSYEATNSEDRLTDPLIKQGDEFRPSRWTDAAKAAALALRTEPERVAVIGGSRLSLESQYAWAKLVKGVIGTDHVDAQLGDGLPAALSLGLPRATIAEVCQPGGIIVLMSADPKEELASLYLRIRHAVVEDGASLIEITPRDTSLSDLASVRLRTSPGTIGQVLAAIAADEIDEAVGSVEPLQLRRTRSLLSGSRPVSVIYGRSNLAESARYTADAVGGLRRICPDARYLPASRRGNINGALEMGLTPGFLPGGARNRDVFIDRWASTPDFEGKDTDGILRAAVAGEIDTLVLLGADPIEDFPDSKLVREAFDHIETIVAVDGFITSSSARADIVLPAALFGEADGTFCNLEGRLSPIVAKVTSPGLARPDWTIAAELSAALGIDLGFNSLAELQAEMSDAVPSLADIDWDAMRTADDGPLLRPERNWDLEFGEAAPAPPASNYGLRLVVDRKLWDLGTMVQNSPSLAALPIRAELRLSPSDVHIMNLMDHDFVTVDHGDISFDLPFVTDPAVAPRTAWLPARLPGFDVRELLSAGRSITNIRVRIPEGD